MNPRFDSPNKPLLTKPMSATMDYREVNKELWNTKAALHVNSDFYDVPSFLAGNSSLKHIELNMLGDIRGKDVLHLQCHFGQDTISLARMGANVTGVDISDVAINKAEALARDLEVEATFFESDVLDLNGKLDQKFDIVFTTYGVISWLPNLEKWANTISHHLKPGGKLIFVESHPVMWMMDENLEFVKYHYFNVEPIIEEVTNSYTGSEFKQKLSSISWNHSISEVVNALISKGLEINSLDEFDYFPYPIFAYSKETSPGQFRPHNHSKIPLTYAIEASLRP